MNDLKVLGIIPKTVGKSNASYTISISLKGWKKKVLIRYGKAQIKSDVTILVCCAHNTMYEVYARCHCESGIIFVQKKNTKVLAGKGKLSKVI